MPGLVAESVLIHTLMAATAESLIWFYFYLFPPKFTSLKALSTTFSPPYVHYLIWEKYALYNIHVYFHDKYYVSCIIL